MCFGVCFPVFVWCVCVYVHTHMWVAMHTFICADILPVVILCALPAWHMLTELEFELESLLQL